jgi:excisionase family DNA binding protein
MAAIWPVSAPSMVVRPTRRQIVDPITMSVKDACAFIGIGKTSFWRYVKDGSIEVVRLGRRTLVRTDSLVALVTGVKS